MRQERLEKNIAKFIFLNKQIKDDPDNQKLIDNFKDDLLDLKKEYVEDFFKYMRFNFNKDTHNLKIINEIIADGRAKMIEERLYSSFVKTVFEELDEIEIIDFIEQFRYDKDVLCINYGIAKYIENKTDLLADYLNSMEYLDREANCFLLSDAPENFEIKSNLNYKIELRNKIDTFINANHNILNNFVYEIYSLSENRHYAMTPTAIDKIDFKEDDLLKILTSALNDEYENTDLSQHIIDKHLLSDLHIETLTDKIWHNLNHEGEAKFVRVLEDLNINILEEDFDYEETRDQLLRLSSIHRTKENVNGF